MITIHLLPVLYGDTILIDVSEERKENINILVDCGYRFDSVLLPLLQKYHEDGKTIDRFIITHYDDDHIRNAAKFIKANGPFTSPQIIKINQVWLNSYRHLQFEKRTVEPLSPGELKLLEDFLTVHKSESGRKESEIGAKQASLLGKELYSLNYSWNEDFNNKAICTEHKENIEITDRVRIRLLGPSQKQLMALDAEFKIELKRMGVPLSESNLIDDAFELYSRSRSKESTSKYTGTISGASALTISIDAINWITRKFKYEPDKATGNGSSIAFILEADEKKILMLGDAHAEPIIEKLKLLYPGEYPIYFDAIKVSHHGSFSNNPKEFYELVDSPLYLISTNGSHPSHVHPDFETIAFIINRPIRGPIMDRKLIFNYLPEHLAGFFDDNIMNHFRFSASVSNKIELQ